MASRVIVDHDILGWGSEHEKELMDDYEEVLLVSKHKDLPQRSFDDKLAAYCKKKNCDLMTGDAKCYTHFFSAGIKAVRIRQYDWWKKGDRAVYLIQIEE